MALMNAMKAAKGAMNVKRAAAKAGGALGGGAPTNTMGNARPAQGIAGVVQNARAAADSMRNRGIGAGVPGADGNVAGFSPSRPMPPNMADRAQQMRAQQQGQLARMQAQQRAGQMQQAPQAEMREAPPPIDPMQFQGQMGQMGMQPGMGMQQPGMNMQPPRMGGMFGGYRNVAQNQQNDNRAIEEARQRARMAMMNQQSMFEG